MNKNNDIVSHVLITQNDILQRMVDFDISSGYDKVYVKEHAERSKNIDKINKCLELWNSYNERKN